MEDLSREIKLIRDARLRLMICTSLILNRFCPRLPLSWLMDQPSCRALSGKTTLAFSHLKRRPKPWAKSSSEWNSNITNVPFSNSSPCTNLKASVTTPMVFLVYPHTRTWRRRSSITFGHSKTTASLTELWSLSVSLPRRWVKLHMLSSEDTTQVKLLADHKVWRHLRTSRIGLEPGHSKDKECPTVRSQCKDQVKTPPTQPSSILVHPNFLFHQTFLRKLDLSGNRPYQISIALRTRLSATSRTVARTLPPNLSQSVSKWVITFSKWTQSNIYTKVMKVNATL